MPSNPRHLNTFSRPSDWQVGDGHNFGGSIACVFRSASPLLKLIIIPDSHGRTPLHIHPAPSPINASILFTVDNVSNEHRQLNNINQNHPSQYLYFYSLPQAIVTSSSSDHSFVDQGAEDFGGDETFVCVSIFTFSCFIF